MWNERAVKAKRSEMQAQIWDGEARSRPSYSLRKASIGERREARTAG